jgi:hypothetical protein
MKTILKQLEETINKSIKQNKKIKSITITDFNSIVRVELKVKNFINQKEVKTIDIYRFNPYKQ